jgi:hypothetical protein
MRLAKGLAKGTDVTWFQHPDACAALLAAIGTYMRTVQEKLSPGDVDEGAISFEVDFPYDPDTVGKMLAKGFLQQEIIAISDAMDHQQETKRGRS